MVVTGTAQDTKQIIVVRSICAIQPKKLRSKQGAKTERGRIEGVEGELTASTSDSGP